MLVSEVCCYLTPHPELRHQECMSRYRRYCACTGVCQITSNMLGGPALRGSVHTYLRALASLHDSAEQGTPAWTAQYMAGGDLGSALRLDLAENGDGAKRRLGWYGRGRLVLLCVARGLVYLHDQRVRPWCIIY